MEVVNSSFCLESIAKVVVLSAETKKIFLRILPKMSNVSNNHLVHQDSIKEALVYSLAGYHYCIPTIFDLTQVAYAQLSPEKQCARCPNHPQCAFSPLRE